jgi:DNA polymerase V
MPAGMKVASVLKPRAGKRFPIPLVLGRVPAGFPSPADDYVERNIDLNDWLIHNRIATYIMKVEGDSISGEIRSGDMLIVDRSLEARHESVVVACVDGEMLVKRLHVEQDGRRFLVSDGPDPSHVEVHAEVTVWGVVTHSIRKMH